MPLGKGGADLDPVGSGNGAVPDCVEKGPFGSEADAPGPPGDWVPAPPGPAVEVTVTVTWTVEVTVWMAGHAFDGLPGMPE